MWLTSPPSFISTLRSGTICSQTLKSPLLSNFSSEFKGDCAINALSNLWNGSGQQSECLWRSWWNTCQIKSSAAIQPNWMPHILQINLAQLTSAKNHDFFFSGSSLIFYIRIFCNRKVSKSISKHISLARMLTAFTGMLSKDACPLTNFQYSNKLKSNYSFFLLGA